MQSVRLEGIAGVMRNTGVPGAWPAHCTNDSSTNCGPIADGRFTDILIDVSNSYGPDNKPQDNTAISCVPAHLAVVLIGLNVSDLNLCRFTRSNMIVMLWASFTRYEKPGGLHLIGGSLGGNVVLGNETNLYSMGVRYEIALRFSTTLTCAVVAVPLLYRFRCMHITTSSTSRFFIDIHLNARLLSTATQISVRSARCPSQRHLRCHAI